MNIGERLRQMREQKNLSQGDIERKTGLLRCYVSRVENEHTVPSVETLEKWARAMDVPLYQLFYDGEKPPEIPKREKVSDGWGATGNGARFLHRFRTVLSRMDEGDRSLLLNFAQKMASKRKS
jgi:transcriptional regulator with XRE-family HTH domain